MDFGGYEAPAWWLQCLDSIIARKGVPCHSLLVPFFPKCSLRLFLFLEFLRRMTWHAATRDAYTRPVARPVTLVYGKHVLPRVYMFHHWRFLKSFYCKNLLETVILFWLIQIPESSSFLLKKRGLYLKRSIGSRYTEITRRWSGSQQWMDTLNSLIAWT